MPKLGFINAKLESVGAKPYTRRLFHTRGLMGLGLSTRDLSMCARVLSSSVSNSSLGAGDLPRN